MEVCWTLSLVILRRLTLFFSIAFAPKLSWEKLKADAVKWYAKKAKNALWSHGELLQTLACYSYDLGHPSQKVCFHDWSTRKTICPDDRYRKPSPLHTRQTPDLMVKSRQELKFNKTLHLCNTIQPNDTRRQKPTATPASLKISFTFHVILHRSRIIYRGHFLKTVFGASSV